MVNNPKIAIVCDWLTEVGGAEKVILAVHKIFPEAPIYTSQYRPKKATWFAGADVRVGWINIFPAKTRRIIPFLRQFYFSHLDLSEYDLVISITGAEAKSVKTSGKTTHISYMHAPTQYYWTLYDQYLKNPGFGIFNSIARISLRLMITPLRRADFKAAQRPNIIVANSNYIKDEILRYYKRDSVVVWPNVDTNNIQRISENLPQPVKKQGYIVFGRQVSWKRIDLAVSAAIKTDSKLLLAGDGPEHDRLVNMAEGHKNIIFLPKYDGMKEIIAHVVAAKAFIFPSVEPFGIAPVEALAAGTPVIALRKGGALDIISEGKNGVFFDEQTVKSLSTAISSFEEKEFNQNEVAQSVEKFSELAFSDKFRKIVKQSLSI